MAEFIRVRDNGNGVETTIPAAWLDTEPGAWTVLDKPATFADGTHLPPKVPAPLADLKKPAKG